MAGKNGKAEVAEAVLELPCTFGNVNIGEATAAIKITVERKHCSLAKADKTLCGHRLQMKLLIHEDGTVLEQGALNGMDDLLELNAVVDVKKIGLSTKNIGCGLTFSLADIDIGSLAKFAKKPGKVIVESVSAIPEKAPAAPEEDDGDE